MTKPDNLAYKCGHPIPASERGTATLCPECETGKPDTPDESGVEEGLKAAAEGRVKSLEQVRREQKPFGRLEALCNGLGGETDESRRVADGVCADLRAALEWMKKAHEFAADVKGEVEHAPPEGVDRQALLSQAEALLVIARALGVSDE